MSLERRNHGRNHSYWIDGVKAVTITEVLGKGIPHPAYAIADVRKAARYATDRWDELSELDEAERRTRIEEAPKQTLRAAAIRGTSVHGFAEKLAAGAEVQVPDDHLGLVDAYLAFDAEWQPKEVLVERPFFSRKWGYGGTPDVVADLADGQRWLLDWKTGASGVWPEHVMQLAAARFAEVWLDDDDELQPVPELGIEATGIVWLRDDRSYDLVPVEAHERAFQAFLYAKGVLSWLKETDRYLGGDPGNYIGDPLRSPLEGGVARERTSG